MAKPNETTPVGTRLRVIDPGAGNGLTLGEIVIFDAQRPHGFTSAHREGNPHTITVWSHRFEVIEEGKPTMADTIKIAVNKDNSVQYGSKIIVKPVTATLALVLGNARNGFNNEDHEAFDNALLDLRSKKFTFKYVDNFRSFLNPETRFHDLIHASVADALQFNKDFKLGFTDDQITDLVTLHGLVKAKIVEVFTPPIDPYPFAKPIDLKAEYGNLANEVQQWVASKTLVASWDLRNRGDNNSEKRAVLRVGTNRLGGVAIQKVNTNNYSISVKRFTTIATKALNWWKDDPKGGTINIGSEQGHSVIAYQNYLKIGCQYVPRAEVERIAQELGMTFPAPKVKLS